MEVETLPPECPFPIQILGGLGREVCTMSPEGGARAAAVLGPQSEFPTSVLGPRPSRPLGQAVLQGQAVLPCTGVRSTQR